MAAQKPAYGVVLQPLLPRRPIDRTSWKFHPYTFVRPNQITFCTHTRAAAENNQQGLYIIFTIRLMDRRSVGVASGRRDPTDPDVRVLRRRPDHAKRASQQQQHTTETASQKMQRGEQGPSQPLSLQKDRRHTGKSTSHWIQNKLPSRRLCR